LGGDDGAVLFRADLHRALGARGRPGRAHHFLARHHHFYGPPGFFCKQRRERLEIDDGLAAKATADFGGDGADVALRKAGQICRHRPHHELALARAPDRGLVVGADADEAGMRLDVALMHRAGREAALDDDFGLRKTLCDVAFLDLELAGDVGGFSFELVELVQDRRVGLDRILDLDRPRQHFVVDFDQFAGFCRDCL